MPVGQPDRRLPRLGAVRIEQGAAGQGYEFSVASVDYNHSLVQRSERRIDPQSSRFFCGLRFAFGLKRGSEVAVVTEAREHAGARIGREIGAMALGALGQLDP